jgi:dipeptidyl aminopeptidase/acylaminoacyl peptidase
MEPMSSFIAHNDQILALAWGPKQVLASASCAQRDPRQWCIKGEVAVWKFGEKGMNPTEVKRFTDHSDWINAIAISPNGKFLATGSGDNLINIYNTKTWEKVNTIKGHTSRVNVLAFPDKDSDLIGSASLDGTARLWQVPDGDQEKLYKADGDKFMAMAFSPDGKMIAAGGSDQKILIWLVKKEKVLKEMSGLEGQVSSLAFSPDGTSLAAGLYDNNILVWKAEKL